MIDLGQSCLVAVIVSAIAVGCDGGVSRSSYYFAEPGGAFCRAQLQCAVNAIEKQRDANKQIKRWQQCEEDIPRLTWVQQQMREAWIVEESARWKVLCAGEIVALQECLPGETEREASLTSI